MTKALRWRSQRCPHCGERIEWRYDLDIRFRSKSRGRARESGADSGGEDEQSARVPGKASAAAKALPPSDEDIRRFITQFEVKGGRGEGKEGAHAGTM